MASSEFIDARHSWCRVCLAVDVRMHWIKNTRLLEVYEKLSSTKLNASDGRLSICYICYSQLQRCCRFSDMCHKSEQLLKELLQNGTEAEGVVPPTAITHNLAVTALPFMSIINYSKNGNTEVKVKEELLINAEEIEDPIDIEESTLVEDVTVNDNKISLEQPPAEGVVPPTAITHNLAVTALPFMSIINYSKNGNTEVKVKEELLINAEEIKDPIDIEESTLVEDVTVNDNKISLEQPPVKLNTDTNNVCGLSYCCDVCNKTFAMKGNLRQHMLIHFNKMPYTCNICNKSFTASSSLIAHKRIHTGEKPYACKICNKSFTRNSYLIIHKSIHTGEKPYACNICNKAFSVNSWLIQHKRIHTGVKPYACNICNKSFTQNSSFTKHKRIHTGEKPYACNLCNKSFTVSCSLIAHKRIHNGEKPYACDICNKSYAVRSRLIAHKRIHTGEKPYACNICNKAFSGSSGLIAHKRIHTGEKPYACNICNKAFSGSSGLIAHKRIHTGEKPYSCNICNKSFTFGSGLTVHKRIHTG